MEEKLNNNLHNINIYSREKLVASDVVEVLSSTEKEIVAKLSDSYLIIYGEDLKIIKLSPEDKIMECKGKVFGLNYQNKLNKKSFFGKVFK